MQGRYMAGMPKRKAYAAAIKRAGGDEWLMDQVGAGRTIGDIASELGMSRAVLNAYLLHSDRRESYARAKQYAAQSLVEQSLEIVDSAQADNVQVCKLQAETRRWIASKLDRATWGEDKGPTVAIQINGLHLDALRQGGRVIGNDDGQ
jgi:hypothetical protein